MNTKPSFKSPSFSVTLENTFDFTSAEYQVLFDASDTTVFQAPFWLATFYNNLIDPLALTPVIITIRDDIGKLLALFPCVRQTSKGIKIIQPADMGVSDYNCIVVREDALPFFRENSALQRQFFDALAPCDAFFFRKQRSDKPKIEDIFTGGLISPNDYNTHEVEIAESYDTWVLRKLSANFRQSNRRKLKKLVAAHGEPKFEIVTEKDKIIEALTFIQTHRGARYDNDILQRPAFFDFYLNLACNHDENAFVQTTTLKIKDELVAAFFGLNHAGRHCYLLGGFIPEKYDNFSIGMLTMMALIEDRIDHGFSIFDFALGNESYKDRFGGKAVHVHNTVYATSTLGTLISYTYKNAKPLKNLLKQLNPKLH